MSNILIVTLLFKIKERWIISLLFTIFCNIIITLSVCIIIYAHYRIGSNLINEFADIQILVRTFSKVCILNKQNTCNAPLVSAIQIILLHSYNIFLPQLVLCTAKLFICDKVTYRQEWLLSVATFRILYYIIRYNRYSLSTIIIRHKLDNVTRW